MRDANFRDLYASRLISVEANCTPRVEKEQRLQDLERRERELSRAIVAKSGRGMRGNLS
jgi:hypothetical protein